MTNLPRIEAILERQAKSWEVRRKLAGEGGEAAREALLHLQEGPWLSVSRQWGSGGIELAEQVGRRLGWEVYDREILTTIAEHTRSRETILSRLERRTIGPFRDYVAQLIVPGDPGRIAYVQEMTQVVWGLARQGQAVILGRGANWFLDQRFGLRLRVVAPLEVRVARVAEKEGIDESQARKQTLEHDANRKAFIHQVFGRDIEDPLGYDLVLNLAAIDRDVGTEIVLAALRRKLHASG